MQLTEAGIAGSIYQRFKSIFPLIGIVALALVMRLVYVWLAPQLDPILQRDPLYGDASGYQLLASNLLKGLGLTWDGMVQTSYRMPGYPVFLAVVYALAGMDLQAARLAQAVLGAATCIPVFVIARGLGGEKAALFAGIGIAFHPLLIYMTGWLYSETLFIFLLWLGLWFAIRAFGNHVLRQALAAGAVLGLAALVRSEIAIFPAFALGLSWLLRLPRRVSWALLIVQVVLLIMVSPWTVRNYIAQGTFVMFATATGSTLDGANNSRADGGMVSDQVFVLPGMSEVESDRTLSQRAWGWIQNHPMEFLQLLPAKLIRFFSPADIKAGASPLGKWLLPVNLAYSVFLLFAGYALTKIWRQQAALVLFALIGWYLLLALIFSGGTRVAMPVGPALVILAGCGLEQVWKTRRAQVAQSVRQISA